jgi:CYTH domain-containing protein
MPLEIERKFLVNGDGYKKSPVKSLYRQGYLMSGRTCIVRVRIAGEKAMLTVKGPSNGAVRAEFEYPVPVGDAKAMLELCEQPLIEKYRYVIDYEGMTWEVDEFLGENQGLVIAEIELPSEEYPFRKPDWVGREVTSDPRYYNSSLVRSPYKTWWK